MTDEIHTMPIDQLRERVRDAESVLQSARNYLRDVAEAPLTTEGNELSQRLERYFDEIQRLLPGFGSGAGAAEDPEEEELKAALEKATQAHRGERVVEGADEAKTEGGEDDAEGDDEGDDAGENEDEAEGDDADADADEDEWEIDLPKFRAALSNEPLMATLPDETRDVFRKLGLRLVDRLERRELIGRVIEGMGEVVEMLEEHSSELGRALGRALTFERLRTMQRS
jgi:hypothetical protein